MILFVLLLFSAIAWADPTPECGFECTNPTSSAICHPYCESAVCEVCHNDTGTPVCSPTLACHVQCPFPVEYVDDACPACETVCPGTLCGSDPDCQVVCEETVCSWDCVPPPPLVKPVCTQVCDDSFCPYIPPPTPSSSLINQPIVIMSTLSIALLSLF